MGLKSIFSKYFGSSVSENAQTEPVTEKVQAASYVLAGKTSLGMLYVDIDKTTIVQKDGQYYLAVHAKEEYTDRNFLKTLRKNKNLQDVVAAVSLFLFDNKGSSYGIVRSFLVDGQGKVCLDCGSKMQMKALNVDDTAMLNAYTLCLKALEIENNKQ